MWPVNVEHSYLILFVCVQFPISFHVFFTIYLYELLEQQLISL